MLNHLPIPRHPRRVRGHLVVTSLPLHPSHPRWPVTIPAPSATARDGVEGAVPFSNLPMNQGRFESANRLCGRIADRAENDLG